jgi:hypothetical protein
MTTEADLIELAMKIDSLPRALGPLYVVGAPLVPLTRTEEDGTVALVLFWRIDNVIAVHPERRAMFDEMIAKLPADLAGLIRIGPPPHRPLGMVPLPSIFDREAPR